MIANVFHEAAEYIDITPELSTRTAVFPGDTPFSRSVTLSFRSGDGYELSQLGGSAHLGAHADAPSHYHPQGRPISEVSLVPYLGPTQVIEVSLKPGARIELKDLGSVVILAKRILFKTNSFADPNTWRADFNSLSPELIEHLAGLGVLLIGIDTPSVDPADSKKLESHQMIWKHGLSILEGLDLSKAQPGLYDLIALPLKIKDGDASWVRAILIPPQGRAM